MGKTVIIQNTLFKLSQMPVEEQKKIIGKDIVFKSKQTKAGVQYLIEKK